MLSYVALLDSRAAGALGCERAGQLLDAFTIFLQEGVRHGAERPLQHASVSAIAQEAIVIAVSELCYLQARKYGPDRESELSHLAGQVSFLALAPFLGAPQAEEFLMARNPPVADPALAHCDQSAARRNPASQHRSVAAA